MEDPIQKNPRKPRKVNRKLTDPSDRKVNVWSSHVKQYCVDNNVKYRDALRNQECRDSYYKKKTDLQENEI